MQNFLRIQQEEEEREEEEDHKNQNEKENTRRKQRESHPIFLDTFRLFIYVQRMLMTPKQVTWNTSVSLKSIARTTVGEHRWTYSERPTCFKFATLVGFKHVAAWNSLSDSLMFPFWRIISADENPQHTHTHTPQKKESH